MIIRNVKGGYDFLPKEQKIRNYINDKLKRIFEQYGYQPAETPILCYYDILSDKYDDDNDILNEIYKLSDQGGRRLGLRYDLTVPFAKLIALNKNEISFPFKRYEIAKAFRDGPVKVGRDREFTQCDVDVVGLSGQLVEAELLSLFVKAFEELKIDIVIKYNSRNLMNGIFLECGINEEDVQKATTVIDKLEKLSKTEIIESLLDIGLNKKQIDTVLMLFELNLEELGAKFENTSNNTLKMGIEELKELDNYLSKLGISAYCKFTPSLARGQNYYTGNVFEVYEATGKIGGSIGAGGRYDKMITNFINDGTEYPTVGISFGLSSIYELIKEREEFKAETTTEIYIIPLETSVDSLIIANSLRTLDINVEVEMNSRKLKKSLDYANKQKIPYVIIIGEEELLNNRVKLKNMFKNEEYEVNLDNLIEIKEILENSNI